MRCLLIDTCTSNLVVSIINDNTIEYLFNSKVDSELSSMFIPIINGAFKKCSIRPNDIDKVFVSNGPGSFTGIRIGLAFAKTFCWALNKDLIFFTSLELIATSSNNNCLSLIDARRGYVYRGFYDSNLNKLSNEKYISIAEVVNEIETYNNLDYYSYDSFENFNVKSVKIDILKLINKHINDKPVNPHELKPSYLKNTEAEEKLNSDKRD
ncbi:MAG: tRNA (adenosine(37)-N6)-threonylcarbamoyltransferase complex dimerization subunit type 1 TsaB [Clostridium sp.]|nr:tRNA (adenosine(37)-N6)-threonylcarbamoyltransferase complex dimerization subunit type 1 TsaB [Clostridium sp.]MCM1444185.1 tRNA (adenosine(37)-N6)-threonylcarbamoyltransferase complex dimerization subunit type 1 TsaB [Candidatus Amulumruptor caecigallinarius]